MMSMLKKIVLFPISLFVAFLALMAKWLLTLSSYVVAPLMLYIFGCGIYTAYRQTWDQFFILLVAEFICFVLFFGVTAITVGIGRFSEWFPNCKEYFNFAAFGRLFCLDAANAASGSSIGCHTGVIRNGCNTADRAAQKQRQVGCGLSEKPYRLCTESRQDTAGRTGQ